MDLDAVRRALLAARLELESHDEGTRDDRKPVELDQTSVGRLSRMDAIQRQAMAQAGQSRRTGELRRITAALKRLDDGEYGFCVACGDEIAPKRLEFDPAVATCVTCASLSS
ncbi:TraR/DksA family transcriptional regulator [Phenylobacterium sp.]|uniref:TraR/DksA family transcriptional regulator n=1 Tax=Phenylobacterium sp. TaxID=1871053 RepID=UPI004035D4F6